MRRADWPERLASCLENWAYRPFSWGEADCAHFAKDVLSAVRCENWSALDLPSYRSAQEAQNALKNINFGSLDEIASRLLGPPQPVCLARRGDLVMVPTRPRFKHGSFGVCLGTVCAAPGASGLVYLPLKNSLISWRI